MPFQSEKQRKYLWANEPEIARDWTEKYGSRVKKQDGGYTGTWIPGYTKPINLDPYIYPKDHAQKFDTRKEWATSPQMYHNEIMNDYVTNVSKNLSEIPYVGNVLAAGTKKQESFLAKEQLYETEKIFVGTLNVKKIWKLSDENDVELLAHTVASKKWNDEVMPPVIKESSKWKINPENDVPLISNVSKKYPGKWREDDYVVNPTYNQRYETNIKFLQTNQSPWKMIEDNISYLNKKYKYDAFQTKEHGRINIMLTDPDNQLVPIHNALRDKNIQTKEWGNGFETKVNWVEDLSQWDIPVTKAITEHRGSFAIEMVM